MVGKWTMITTTNQIAMIIQIHINEMSVKSLLPTYPPLVVYRVVSTLWQCSMVKIMLSCYFWKPKGCPISRALFLMTNLTFGNPPQGWIPLKLPAFARPTMSSFLSFARFSKVFCLGSSQPEQQGLQVCNKKVWIKVPTKKFDAVFEAKSFFGNRTIMFYLCQLLLTSTPSIALRREPQFLGPHGFGCFPPATIRSASQAISWKSYLPLQNRYVEGKFGFQSKTTIVFLPHGFCYLWLFQISILQNPSILPS